MIALAYHGPADFRCDTVDDPAILEDGDAIVAVDLAAICGSDLHVWRGSETGLDPGTVLGHEMTGRVVATGRGVRRLKIGDRVMCPFSTSCGDCFFCARGLSARCERGLLFGWVERGRGLHGAQAELVRVPLADSTLLEVPDDLGPMQALVLGDVLATGWHCARMAEVGPGSVCVVIGCGPVGLMAVLAAHEQGAERVFAIDTVPERLALAARIGAEPLDARVTPPLDVVRDATAGRGADAVLEAVGSRASGELAFELVRAGGTIAVVGVHHEASFPFSPGAAYDRNLTFRIGRCPARSLMAELIPVARRHAGLFDALFTHRVRFEDGPAAYAMFDARRDGCIKVALVPDSATQRMADISHSQAAGS